MLKLLFTIPVFFSASFVFAQNANFEWVRTFKSTPLTAKQDLTDMAIDDNGNIYSVGTFTLTVDFDPGPAVYDLTSGSTDLFISKIDASGNFVWAKQIESNGIVTRFNCLDREGNICITGQFNSLTDFDPGPAVSSLNTSLGFDNTFILKLDPDGNFIWAKSLVNLNAFDNVGVALKSDQTNNIYVTGYFRGMVDLDPGAASFVFTDTDGNGSLYILKLDPAGNFVWAKQIKTASPFAISTDNNGAVCITGFFSATTDFDPGPGIVNLTPLGLTDIFIIKLDSDGNLAWARSVGGSSNDSGLSVTTDNLGNIYTSGTFFNVADFDPGPGVYNLATTPGNITATFILKMDSQGNFIWAKAIGGGSQASGNSISLDDQKNIYVTGYFWGTADLDPGPGLFNLSAGSSYNGYVLKLNPAGNFVWAKLFDGGLNQGLSIAIDHSRNVYTAGRYFQIVDFDPGTAVFYLTAAGIPNAFIHKLNQPCIANTFSILNINACESYTLNDQIFTTSGTYTQVIPNTAGCDSTITLNLAIGKRSTSIDTAICEGQTYFAAGADQTSSGIYKDTLLTTLGCDSIVTTYLTVHPKPTPDLGLDKSLCVGAPAVISPGIFPGYLWQDMSTASTFTINSSGTYWVIVKDANNCTATDSLNILSIDTLPANFLPSDQSICLGASVNITVPGYKTYLWNTGSTINTISITTIGTYYLSVTDNNNCSGTDSIIVKKKIDCIPISIPNAFTPNKDGTNDIFKPTITLDIEAYSFTIFNRYGQKVFETKIYPSGWNGTYKGKDQPVGSYVYFIHYKTGNGLLTEEKGTFLLLR